MTTAETMTTAMIAVLAVLAAFLGVGRMAAAGEEDGVGD